MYGGASYGSAEYGGLNGGLFGPFITIIKSYVIQLGFTFSNYIIQSDFQVLSYVLQLGFKFGNYVVQLF